MKATSGGGGSGGGGSGGGGGGERARARSTDDGWLSDDSDAAAARARKRRQAEARAAARRAREANQSHGMMGSAVPPRKRPRLAWVGGGVARVTAARGEGARGSNARHLWRARLLKEGGRDDEDEEESSSGSAADSLRQSQCEHSTATRAHSPLPALSPPSYPDSDSGSSVERGHSWRSRALRRAQEAVSNRDGKLLEPALAASLIGYDDPPASFWNLPPSDKSQTTDSAAASGGSGSDNGGDGAIGEVGDGGGVSGRRAVEFAPHEELPSEVDVLDYSTLRAFNSGGPKGWGVCCTQPVRAGQVVTEVRGRCLSESEFSSLENRVYVFGFDEEVLALKRQVGDEVRYLDLREHGNLSRLFNDEQIRPSMALMAWPPLNTNSTPPTLPKRFYLVANFDVPPLTELTWDYGDMYYRPWQEGEEGEEGDDDDADSDATDDDIEWHNISWAQCDACQKWRKLPGGPEYCEDALPEKWYCSMNAPTHTNSCEEPEDVMEDGEVYEGEEGEEEGEEEEEEEEKEAVVVKKRRRSPVAEVAAGSRKREAGEEAAAKRRKHKAAAKGTSADSVGSGAASKSGKGQAKKPPAPSYAVDVGGAAPMATESKTEAPHLKTESTDAKAEATDSKAEAPSSSSALEVAAAPAPPPPPHTAAVVAAPLSAMGWAAMIKKKKEGGA